MRNNKATGILFLLCLTSLQTLIATNPIFEVTVEEGPSRHYFTLTNDTSVVNLQQLLPGQTYTIFVSGDQKDCLPIFLEATDNPAVVLSFVAEATAHFVSVGKSCTDALDIRFSIACTSCPERVTMRNPMGISTDQNYSATELIQDVLISGDCFDVDEQSISALGHNLSQGYFSNGANSIDLEEGIILSTGSVLNAAGPNDVYNTGNTFFSSGGDLDLSDMVGSNSIYDVTSLEFDFTPTTDQVSFDFVFASEEYCEYAGSSFNDVFGFFISGPGINGPFTNGAENIALVPFTNNYTSINSVNHQNNSAYYVNNIPSDHHNTMPLFLNCPGYPVNTDGVAINFIEYDGFTTAMTARADVQACETYHIKLIIADVTDGYFDSAVFLRANSFSAGQAAQVSTQAPGGADAANIAYEDCMDSYFVFERPNDDLSTPLTVNYTLSNASTATAGVDYAPLPTSVTIPAGDSIYLLPVDIYTDGLVEGAETIILDLEAPCSCDQPFITLYVDDGAAITIQTDDEFFCDPTTITIAPIVSGGVGDLSYQWSNGATTPTIDVLANTTTNYTLNVTDICGNTASATTAVSIVPIPTATISGYEWVCAASPDAEILIELSGVGPWDITYSIDNVEQAPITGITTSPYILSSTTLGTYHLESVAAHSCEGTVQGAATVAPAVISAMYTSLNESCPESADGSIELTPSGGLGPYTYAWDNGLAPVANPTGLGTGVYSVTIMDANGCDLSQVISVGIEPNAPIADAGPDTILTCTVTAVDLSGVGSASNLFNQQWSTADGNILANGNSYHPTIDQPGTYQLQVINVNSGCTATDQVEVMADTTAPVANINTLGATALDCAIAATTLDASGSIPFAQMQVEWSTQDGNILNNVNDISTEVDASGLYILEVLNMQNGCVDTAQIQITADFARPQLSIAAPEVITCQDSIIILSATNASPGANYTLEWMTANGNFVMDEQTLSPVIDQPGTYTLNILNTDNQCESSDSVIVMEDREAPIIDAGPNALLTCTVSDLSLSGEGANNSSLEIQWLTMDGNIVDGATTYTPLVDQAGVYELQVTNISNGCWANDQVQVFIDTMMPSAAINTLGPLVLNCANRVTTLDASGSTPSGSLTYLWSTEGGNIMGEVDELNPAVDAGGLYILEVINDQNGCTDTTQLEITADFTLPQIAITTPDLLTCYDSVITIPALNSSSGTNYTILWTTSDGHIVTNENTLDPTVDQPGVYTLTIFNTSNQCASTDSVFVAEDRETPIADAGLPTEIGCNEEQVPLDGTASSTGTHFTYQWLSADGMIESGADGLSPEVSSAGTYSIFVLNTENGCSAADEVVITEDTDVPYAIDIAVSEPQCYGEDGAIAIPVVYGGQEPYVYSIDGGTTYFSDFSFAELQPGNFALQVQDAEGCVYDSVAYIAPAYQVIVEVEPEVTIGLGETYTMRPTVNIPFSSINFIRWSTGEDLDCEDCWEPTAAPLNTTLYGITIIDDNGCPASAEILVRVDKDRKIFIPNAFSPNVDGMNDRFHIFAKEGLVTRITNFQIFNRWGGKVFEVKDAMPNDPSFGWDGRVGGELVNPAVYIYCAEIEFVDGEKIMYKGDVTVVD